MFVSSNLHAVLCTIDMSIFRKVQKLLIWFDFVKTVLVKIQIWNIAYLLYRKSYPVLCLASYSDCKLDAISKWWLISPAVVHQADLGKKCSHCYYSPHKAVMESLNQIDDTFYKCLFRSVFSPASTITRPSMWYHKKCSTASHLQTHQLYNIRRYHQPLYHWRCLVSCVLSLCSLELPHYLRVDRC